MSAELHRHVNALVADLAAEHGEVDLVGRRVDCDPDDHDALVDSFESFGVVGGAGIRVRDDDGHVLLARFEEADGWVDPGDSRLPGESYRECARRALGAVADIEADIDGLAQVQLLYFDDWTDRQPVPNPYICFDAHLAEGAVETTPGDGVAALRWADSVPEDLLYDELAELSLCS